MVVVFLLLLLLMQSAVTTGMLTSDCLHSLGLHRQRRLQPVVRQQGSVGTEFLTFGIFQIGFVFLLLPSQFVFDFVQLAGHGVASFAALYFLKNFPTFKN
jgi:hypothetical protein